MVLHRDLRHPGPELLLFRIGMLERVAKDHIHRVEGFSPEDLRPHYLSQTRHAVIELCGDAEQELRDLVNNVERLTGIKADYI